MERFDSENEDMVTLKAPKHEIDLVVQELHEGINRRKLDQQSLLGRRALAGTRIFAAYERETTELEGIHDSIKEPSYAEKTEDETFLENTKSREHWADNPLY